jgi:4-hydroxy-tetrahydrodipicolinate synthase
MAQPSLVGAMTALVTPFRGGRVDDAALRALIEEQIGAGIDGLVPVGTTGEAPTLEPEEAAQVVRVTVDAARKRVPVIAGIGSNSTAHTVANARAARDAGADALLVVTPYYNKPTQEGLYRHFRAVAEATPLPIVVYNIPGRSVIDLSVDTLERLVRDEPRIAAVKEASGQAQRTQEIVRRLGDRVSVLSGEDALNLALYSVGARGCISVTSNVVPKLVAEAWDAVEKGDFARARAAHLRTVPLTDALFAESSPQPLKAALAMLGRIDGEIRLPLVPCSEATREKVRAALGELGLGAK